MTEPRNEAAERLTECRHARVWRPLPDEPIWECEQCGEPFTAERAAPKVDALNVERLAKAAHLASGFSLGTFDDSDCGDRIYAEAVAAEYARLEEREGHT